jgi:hypothetical protein
MLYISHVNNAAVPLTTEKHLKQCPTGITILDVIQCPVFYLKHYVSETASCSLLQVKPIQLGARDRASLCHPETETSSILGPTE